MRMTRAILVGCFLLMSFSGSLPAAPLAQEMVLRALPLKADPAHGRILFVKHCASCHGRSAYGNGPREVPSLAGQHEYFLLQQLARIATLDRALQEMHEILRRPDVDQAQSLRDLAGYLAGLQRSPDPEHGDKTSLPAGARIYAGSCVGCHDGNGEGNNKDPIPMVGGQHYHYLLARLRTFGNQHSSVTEPPILEFTAALNDTERQAVADYISRLPGRPAATKGSTP